MIDLKPVLEPVRAHFRVPGLGVALVRDGKLSAIGTTGIRRVGSTQRLEIHDPFHLGSCGKAVTATLAAVMVESGAMEWTLRIGQSYPELDSTIHSRYRDVTLEELLAHRGGFAARDLAFDQRVATFEGAVLDQRSSLVRYAVANVPAYEPGTRFVYSDIGYSIGGAMLARSDGRTWEELVVELVAKPLQLGTLGFGAPGKDDPEASPRGHVLKGGSLVALGVGPTQDLAHPAIGPAGTIHMSLGDWAKFAMLHLQGSRGEDTELLPASAFAVLHQDFLGQGYGLGWFLTDNPWSGGRALTHTGSCGAWSAVIWILPEQNAAILAATNFGGGNGYQSLQMAVDKVAERFLVQ